jgi:hypothetical protein
MMKGSHLSPAWSRHPASVQSLPNIAPQALTPPASICAAPLGDRSETPSATLRSTPAPLWS